MTPGQAAWSAYWGDPDGDDQHVWDMCAPDARAAWEAAAQAGSADLRALVREILREVELGTLGQHTPAATTRTLAKTAAWRKRARLDGQS